MSTIYIHEPPTFGKVVLETTFGDADIELWSKEAPRACRNFVQLCIEGYYDGTIFHRVIKGFIAQGGDPGGTGMGGESIYGHPFKDEFHSRLRFVRRGLVAMANGGRDDNGSQFFFTLGPCPELQNKHTIFGKVTGNTLYNVLKLEESLVDHNDRPLYPHKIICTKVLSNPFLDIMPRNKLRSERKLDVDISKNSSKGTKNFSLLSFGEEAEEEEAEVDAVAKEFRGKSKSSHDLIDDPELSSVPAVEVNTEYTAKQKATESEGAELDKVKKKLKKDPDKNNDADVEKKLSEKTEATKPDSVEEIKKEIRKLKKELANKKKTKEETKEIKDETSKSAALEETTNDLLAEFHRQAQKYREVKKEQPKKGQGREQQTLALLAKFQSKIEEVKEQNKDKNPTESSKILDDEEEDADDIDSSWLAHNLCFEEQGPALAKDASVGGADTYEIFDPRNPINQRRREASKHAMKEKR